MIISSLYSHRLITSNSPNSEEVSSVMPAIQNLILVLWAQFFQRPDDGFNQDVYQIGLLLAVIYFVVQFLKTVL